MNMRNLRKFSIAALAAAMLALGLTGCEKDPVKEATPEVINQLGQQAFELITRQRSKCYIYIQKMDQPSPLVINASKWPVKIHGYKTLRFYKK